MPFGLGFMELLVALAIMAVPVAAVAWVLRRLMDAGSGQAAASAQSALRAQHAAVVDQLSHLEARLEQVEQRLDFTEQLHAGRAAPAPLADGAGSVPATGDRESP